MKVAHYLCGHTQYENAQRSYIGSRNVVVIKSTKLSVFFTFFHPIEFSCEMFSYKQMYTPQSLLKAPWRFLAPT